MSTLRHSPEEITAMHRALHRACGLPSLSPTYADISLWATVFLPVMAPLEADTEEGRFTLHDLIEVLAEMNRQREQGVGWSMRPAKILRDPETIRDMVLQVREKKRARQRPRLQRRSHTTADAHGPVTREAQHDPAQDESPDLREHIESSLASLRNQIANPQSKPCP